MLSHEFIEKHQRVFWSTVYHTMPLKVWNGMGNHLGYARLLYKELLDTMADFGAFMHHFNIHYSLISIYIPYHAYLLIYNITLNKFSKYSLQLMTILTIAII